MFVLNISGTSKRSEDSAVLVFPDPTPFDITSMIHFCFFSSV